MRMKCGSIVNDQAELEDATWEYNEDDGKVDVYTDDGFWVLSINAEDFFPLVAAIKEAISEEEKKIQ